MPSIRRPGSIRWQATLGVSDNLPIDKQDTGRPNIGGPIVTAGGLVFIGATDDNRFRAFDARSGDLLWSHTLEASAHATPISYRGADGRQYVAVTATGGSFLDSPVTADTLVAFALPRRGPPDPYAGRKRLLVVADLSTGNQIAHLATSHAIATIEKLGRESGAYVAILRTDTDLVTKGEVWGTGEYAADGPRRARMHNLDYFDAVLFYTNGETRMTEAQKRDLLDFIGKDGKGFIGVHTAAITAASWPEYAEMLGGFFDNHPWNVASARIVVERPDSPIMRGFSTGMELVDEHYQLLPQPYDRSKVDVLARLDPTSVDLADADVHRADADFPVAWIKPYGNGRVFYSYLGHTDAAWDDPRVQTMYLEAIKWAIGGGETPRPHRSRRREVARQVLDDDIVVRVGDGRAARDHRVDRARPLGLGLARARDHRDGVAWTARRLHLALPAPRRELARALRPPLRCEATAAASSMAATVARVMPASSIARAGARRLRRRNVSGRSQAAAATRSSASRRPRSRRPSDTTRGRFGSNTGQSRTRADCRLAVARERDEQRRHVLLERDVDVLPDPAFDGRGSANRACAGNTGSRPSDKRRPSPDRDR